MKVLFLDDAGSSFSLALKAKWFGHEVVYYSKDRNITRIGEGLVRRTQTYENFMDWADFIYVGAEPSISKAVAPYLKKGYPILSTSLEAIELELDRMYGQRVLESVGIPCLPVKEFSSFDDAIAYVIATNGRYVCKPCKDVGREFTYVSKSPEDMIYMLSLWKKEKKLNCTFILQEFTEGVEFGVTGWFGSDGWLSVWAENFEHKKLMNDEKGPNTIEMGTAVKYVKKSALAEELLRPLTGILHALHYRGCIDISVMVDKHGQAWPLEFTARPGWPISNVILPLHKGDPIEWMLDMINGKDTLKVKEDHAIGVVVALPDMPYYREPLKNLEGVPIFGLTPKLLKTVLLNSVMSGTVETLKDGKTTKEEMYVNAGFYPCISVGLGDSVLSAKEKAYDQISKLTIPASPIYRTDIGDKLEKGLQHLQRFGYAPEWSFS